VFFPVDIISLKWGPDRDWVGSLTPTGDGNNIIIIIIIIIIMSQGTWLWTAAQRALFLGTDPHRRTDTNQSANTSLRRDAPQFCLPTRALFSGRYKQESFKLRGQQLRNNCGCLRKLIFICRVTVTSDDCKEHNPLLRSSLSTRDFCTDFQSSFIRLFTVMKSAQNATGRIS
jgi:hypothetical protein